MANFFAELKRRHIYRVAAAYAVVAWVLLQLINNVAPVLDLPVWVARAFLLALVIGFPVAIFLAWVRELAPADGTAVRATTGKLDWALIGVLFAVLAVLSYQQFAPSQASKISEQVQASASSVRAALGNPTGALRQLWDPLYAPVRKSPRFKKYVRETGLVDYWRARGWPDLCRPMGADDFECN